MIPAALLVAAALAHGAAQPSTIPEMWREWCARCHATDGSGKVESPTITVEPMDFTDCAVATAEPDADWELAIVSGGPAVGLSSEMPAFGDALTSEQVRGFVAHIRGFCAERGWPIGNANFPRPIFTEKAYPENELVILPVLTRRSHDAASGDRVRAPADRATHDFDLRAIYERRFGQRGMWELTLPVASHDTRAGTRRQGVGDIEAAVKYVLAVDNEAARIVSAGFELALPTGSRARDLGRGTTMMEPYIAAAALAGEFYLQGQIKLELPADASRADRAVVYNVFAGRDTSMAPSTWTLGIEMNGEDREVALTPQLRKGLTATGALGAALGVRLPVNERQEQGVALVGYLLWEYREPIRARR